MNKLPNFLTHYTKSVPIRSLTANTCRDWPALVRGLSEENTLAYARFARPTYLNERVALERRLRADFVAAGGKPASEHPYYLVLGRSPWFERHEPNVRVVTVAIADVDPDCVSFTYGDSMTSYMLRDGTWPNADALALPHHGRVFRLDELSDLVEALGIPDGPTAGCPDHYIEAQLWDDPPN